MISPVLSSDRRSGRRRKFRSASARSAGRRIGRARRTVASDRGPPVEARSHRAVSSGVLAGRVAFGPGHADDWLDRCSSVEAIEPDHRRRRACTTTAVLADSLGIARRVSIGVCDRLAVPVLVGVVRPLILCRRLLSAAGVPSSLRWSCCTSWPICGDGTTWSTFRSELWNRCCFFTRWSGGYRVGCGWNASCVATGWWSARVGPAGCVCGDAGGLGRVKPPRAISRARDGRSPGVDPDSSASKSGGPVDETDHAGRIRLARCFDRRNLARAWAYTQRRPTERRIEGLDSPGSRTAAGAVNALFPDRKRNTTSRLTRSPILPEPR